jgi:2'-5' RNA ligase
MPGNAGGGITRREVLVGAASGIALVAIEPRGAHGKLSSMPNFSLVKRNCGDKTMNVFICIPIPTEIAEFLGAIVKQRFVNVVRLTDYHITVEFIGKANGALILSILSTIPISHPIEHIQLNRIGTFDGPETTITFASVIPNVWLNLLHQELDRRFQPYKTMQSKHDFVPHVTLAYLSGPLSRQELDSLGGKLPNLQFMPTELAVLTADERHRGGPYRRIGRVPVL